jgi:hypothetical protein
MTNILTELQVSTCGACDFVLFLTKMFMILEKHFWPSLSLENAACKPRKVPNVK